MYGYSDAHDSSNLLEFIKSKALERGPESKVMGQVQSNQFIGAVIGFAKFTTNDLMFYPSKRTVAVSNNVQTGVTKTFEAVMNFGSVRFKNNNENLSASVTIIRNETPYQTTFNGSLFSRVATLNETSVTVTEEWKTNTNPRTTTGILTATATLEGTPVSVHSLFGAYRDAVNLFTDALNPAFDGRAITVIYNLNANLMFQFVRNTGLSAVLYPITITALSAVVTQLGVRYNSEAAVTEAIVRGSYSVNDSWDFETRRVLIKSASRGGRMRFFKYYSLAPNLGPLAVHRELQPIPEECGVRGLAFPIDSLIEPVLDDSALIDAFSGRANKQNLDQYSPGITYFSVQNHRTRTLDIGNNTVFGTIGLNSWTNVAGTPLAPSCPVILL